MFHRALVEPCLSVPATLGPVDDSASTWVANGGAFHRIDYVAVPCTWDCGARGAAATLLRLGRLAMLPSLVRCMLLILPEIGRTTILWPCVPLWSSGGHHVAPSGVLRALTCRPQGPCVL